MQENNPTPVVNSPQITEVQSVLMPNDQQPKTNNFLVILLSVLLFVSVSIAGFFAFQTQKLVKELTALKSEEKVVAVATEIPTTEPVATDSTTVDPTADWKTYTNIAYKYSISYPSTYNISNQADGATGAIPANANNIFISESSNSKYEDRLIDINNVGMLVEITPVNEWKKTSVTISGVNAFKFTKIDKTSSFDIYQVKTNGSGGLEIYVNNKDAKSTELLNSLKFTN